MAYEFQVMGRAASDAEYCDRCGATMAGDGPGHAACRTARMLEPPRYCVRCGRRTVVQVTPDGWSSTCSRHGLRTSPG
jgi:hypothetical protein